MDICCRVSFDPVQLSLKHMCIFPRVCDFEGVPESIRWIATAKVLYVPLTWSCASTIVAQRAIGVSGTRILVKDR